MIPRPPFRPERYEFDEHAAILGVEPDELTWFLDHVAGEWQQPIRAEDLDWEDLVVLRGLLALRHGAFAGLDDRLLSDDPGWAEAVGIAIRDAYRQEPTRWVRAAPSGIIAESQGASVRALVDTLDGEILVSVDGVERQLQRRLHAYELYRIGDDLQQLVSRPLHEASVLLGAACAALDTNEVELPAIRGLAAEGPTTLKGAIESADEALDRAKTAIREVQSVLRPFPGLLE